MYGGFKHCFGTRLLQQLAVFPGKKYINMLSVRKSKTCRSPIFDITVVGAVLLKSLKSLPQNLYGVHSQIPAELLGAIQD